MVPSRNRRCFIFQRSRLHARLRRGKQMSEIRGDCAAPLTPRVGHEPKMPTEERKELTFLNRDHIVLVTIGDGEIVVTTTAGTIITIPIAGAALERFVDDLANHVESNFVAVVGEPRVIS